MHLNIRLPENIKDLSEDNKRKIVDEIEKALDLSKPVPIIQSKEHGIWERNNDPFLADAEEEFYEALLYPAMDDMATLIAALDLVDEHIDVSKSFSVEYMSYEADLIKGKAKKNKASELMELAKKKRKGFLKYLQGSSNWAREKLAQIDEILRRKLPSYEALAEKYTTRAALIGKIRNEADREALDMVGSFVDHFPETIKKASHEELTLTTTKPKLIPKEVQTALVIGEEELNRELSEARAKRATHKLLPLQPQEIRTVENAKLRTAEKITEMSLKYQSQIKQTVIQAINSRWSAQKLAQTLFDKFGELNRNWYRIAVTELAMASNDGYLANCKEGDTVYVPAVDGSCKYCKQYLENKTFTVTQDPKKMGYTHSDEMAYVWIGKSNVGHTTSTYIPCIPLHPLCRHRYHSISRFYKLDENGKLVLKDIKELIQEERKRKGLPPDKKLK